MYISLYRRYRPQSFSDVVGQSAAIGVITRAIENGTMGHAYLFSGPRGCGKTTIARLFAKAVNCPNRKGAEPCNECDTCRSIVEGSCLDVIEIDGASNNSVDEIRDLKEHVALASFTCPYKVYIIDEVHMLSISAFNALLKTLEEPPERVIFILATTAPHKVPVTIRSRCQHIPFHGMTSEQIVSRLDTVAAAEGLEVQNEALWEIARNSEGGMRDALSLMEQAIAYGTGAITRETIDKLLGGGSSSSIRKWLSLCHNEPAEALPNLEALFRSGAVPERFLSVLFTCVRNLWLQSRWGDRVLSSLMLSEEEKNWLKNERTSFTQQHLERLMSLIASLLPQVRRGISNDVLCGLLVSWLMITDSAPVTFSEQPFKSESELKAQFKPQITTVPQTTEKETAAQDDFTLPLSNTVQTSKSGESKVVTDAAISTAVSMRPDPVGLAVVDAWLKDTILSEMSNSPQIVIPLLMSDIVFDSEQKNASLCLDAADASAFEVLKDSRSISFIRNILLSHENDVKSISVFCGDQSETFTESAFNYEPISAVVASHANEQEAVSSPTETREPMPVAAELKRSFSENDLLAASARNTGNTSLPNFLRGFMEASLLYCRPNDESDDSTEAGER